MSSRIIRVFTPQEVVESLSQSDDNLKFSDPKKTPKGVQFSNVELKDVKTGKYHAFIWNFQSIVMPRNIQTKSQDDKKGGKAADDTRAPTIYSTINDVNDPHTAAALLKIQEVYHRKIETALANKTLKTGNPKICAFVSDKYPENHDNSLLAGKPRPSPNFSLKMELDEVFSATCPFETLRGQKKTTLYDASTEKVKDGKTVYEELKCNGKALTSENVAEVLKSGSCAVRGRVMQNALTLSNFGISMPAKVLTAIISPPTEGGFSDEFFSSEAAPVVETGATETTPTTETTLPTPKGDDDAPPEYTEESDEIDNALDNL